MNIKLHGTGKKHFGFISLTFYLRKLERKIIAPMSPFVKGELQRMVSL
jgi:hypothetical protein